MTRISELWLNFIVNSGWQMAVIFIAASTGAYLLRNAPAGCRHTLWLITLGLSLGAPLWTISGPALSFRPAAVTDARLPWFSSPVADPQRVSGDDENDTAFVDRLLVRRRQVVNVTPASFLLMSAGFFLFGSFRLIRLVRLWRKKEELRQSARPISTNEVVDAAVARCRRAFGGRNFCLLSSRRAVVPVTLGARAPVIILPEHLGAERDEETLVSIIGHEVAHVSRRDFSMNFICELISLPISFHPLTYLIKREIDRARELACDELVTDRLVAPQSYARSLVRLANATDRHATALALSILDGNILEERIMKLTCRRARLSRRVGRTITCAVLAALVLAVLLISSMSFDLRAEARVPNVSNGGANIDYAAAIRPTGSPIPAGNARQSNVSQSTPSIKVQSAQERARTACEAEQQQRLESIPMLTAMLADDNRTELIRCWESGRWGPALEIFKHPSPGEQAALALASMGPPAFEPLMNQLSSSNATVRRNAAWAIGELTGMVPNARAASVPQLIALLGDSEAWTRMAAARALGELHDQRATAGLVATLSDADPKVRELSAWALSEMKDSRAVSALCNVLLNDPQFEVRRTAAEALGEIRSAEGLASLKQALNDPEARVRAKAVWAISEIED